MDSDEEHPNTINPLLICLTVAVAIVAGLLRIDGAAKAARYDESIDLTRGQIVDRNGRPLVWSALSDGTVRRRYAFPDLPTVLGFQKPGGGWTALEGKYDSFLDATKAKRDWRTFFLHLRGQAARGGTLRLTIDSRVQAAAERALGRAQGSIVAVDPRTGGVLAFVSHPSCPASTLATAAGYRTCAGRADSPLLNRAVHLLVAPGSSFKIVTLSAALDTHTFSLSSVFSGADAFGPSPYFDNNLYPSNVTRSDLTQLTLPQALAFSDNFTFAHIGLTLGWPTLARYAHRYMVGRTIPFDYPVARSVIANGEASPSPSTVAQSSFGAGVDRVTPLQMALIAATVANGGVMMAPHLVQDLESPGERVLWRYHPHVLSRVMAPSAAAQVTEAMVFVVDHGSGYRAQIAGMKVAGKTGTAVSGTENPNAWFITFAPSTGARVATAVLHQFSGEGFEYAAPLARQVLVAALRLEGYRVRGKAPSTPG